MPGCRSLRSHQGKPITHFWIDHPYGEDELTLLEGEQPGAAITTTRCQLGHGVVGFS